MSPNEFRTLDYYITKKDWDPNPVRIYTEGEIVVHNGQFWQALWWTRGQEPGTTEEWGPWKLIGDVPARE